MHRIVARVKQSTRNPTIALKSRREKWKKRKSRQDLQKMRQTALRQRRPRRESPPKFGSPCSDASSFLDRSTHSDSSISQIYLKISYAPAYKKSKIKQKVQTVNEERKGGMASKGNNCETWSLGEIISLLFCKLQSKISDDAWQMILNRPNLGKSGVSCALNELRLLILV